MRTPLLIFSQFIKQRVLKDIYLLTALVRTKLFFCEDEQRLSRKKEITDIIELSVISIIRDVWFSAIQQTRNV